MRKTSAFVLFAILLITAYPSYAATCTKEAGRGVASWYGPGFAGKKTMSGEPFQPATLSAAHPSLPFGTMVKVTNLRNAQSVNVRINDRGAFKTNIIDVSQGAAHELDMIDEGTAPVALYVCGQ